MKQIVFVEAPLKTPEDTRCTERTLQSRGVAFVNPGLENP